MPALWLVNRANTISKPSIYKLDPIQGYLGVDYLDWAMLIFNKLSILPPIKLSL